MIYVTCQKCGETCEYSFPRLNPEQDVCPECGETYELSLEDFQRVEKELAERTRHAISGCLDIIRAFSHDALDYDGLREVLDILEDARSKCHQLDNRR